MKKAARSSSGNHGLAWRKAVKLALLAGITVACGAGAGDTERVARTRGAVMGAAGATRGEVRLSAARIYSPLKVEDGAISIANEFEFAVPASLRVTVGNAGAGVATLSVSGGASGPVECTYIGGAGIPHPVDPPDVANGLHYLLQYCTGNRAAGDAVTATDFTLHVEDGDSLHAFGMTGAAVTLRPGSAVNPDLPPMPAGRPFPEFVASAPVGILGGKSSVSVTGEFQYQIPIAVPRGRTGLEPALSLSYASRAGDGVLGVGWRLNGVPQIRPCPSTRATEGRADGVHYDDEDRYCLDGSKLVAIQGTYGRDGAEYRTEEDSFTRVRGTINAAGEREFTAWTKDGRVLKFLPVHAWRYQYEGIDVPPHPEPRSYVWPVMEIADRAGNKIRFQYWLGDEKPYLPDVNELLPTRIMYVRDNPGGPQAERAVSFFYEARPDVGFEWVSGVKMTRSKRLQKIVTTVGARTAAELRFGYMQSAKTGRSLLSTVTHCDGDPAGAGAPVCLPPKVLAWDTNTARVPWTSFDAPTPDINGSNPGVPTRMVIADLDGDGRDDAVYQLTTGNTPNIYTERVRFSQGQTFGAPLAYGAPTTSWEMANVRPIEINGDGRAHILCAGAFGQRYGLQVLRADRVNGTFVAVGPPYLQAGTLPAFIDFVDADGDGRLDMFGAHLDEPPIPSDHISFRPNLGGSFGAAADVAPYCLESEYVQRFTPRGADFLGSGRSLWLVKKCGASVTSGARTDSSGVLSMNDADLNLPLMGEDDIGVVFADLNGDGLKDALYPFRPVPEQPGGVATTIKVRWNTGHGFTTMENLVDPNAFVLGFDLISGDRGLRVADVNGDGRDDLVKFVSNRNGQSPAIWVFESKPPGFRSYVVSNAPGLFHADQGWLWASVGDVDGDGMTDIVTTTQAFPATPRTLLNTDLRPDLLTRIEDGLVFEQRRKAESVVYSMSWDKEHQPPVSYPQRPVMRGVVIVQRHFDRYGGQDNETDYSYQDETAPILRTV